MSEHLARHVLERLLVDHPRDPIAPVERAHLSDCERCAERMKVLVLARSEHASRRPAMEVARAVEARAQERPRRSVRPLPPRPLAVAAALAAAAILAIALPGSRRAPDPDAIRYKGLAAAFHAYIRKDAKTHALRDGERLHAGDQLAFTYTLSRPQHLVLYGIDDAGTINRYFPDPALAAGATALPAGSTRQLPVGIELDARRGRERLVALFSSEPIDDARARAALSSALRVARTRGEGIAELGTLALPGSQVSLWFEKP